MKVAITGHTRGIGQGLYNYFQERGHDVYGFSRSNGFALPDTESQVLDKIKDCDIFINNALPVSSQIFLLKELWPQWKNINKKIIVLSSVATQMTSVASNIEEYRQQKLELDRLCKSFQYSQWPFSQCSIMVIHPGFVATDLIADLDLPANQCMSVDQVVSVVDYMLNSPLAVDSVVFRKK